MALELRKTGISVLGDMPWGVHFCHFYETKQDLLDTLIPYFKAGLENKEFCVWVVSTPELITVEEAKAALAQAVPDLDRHLSDENIEILNGPEWYLEENVFSLERATNALDAKLKRALARGCAGMRASGDTFWLAEKDWKDFFAYEKQLNESITNQPMTVLCTYPLAKSGATEVLDVVQAHQFAIARRQGEWEVIETPELIQAKGEIKRLNQELEQRVVKRTDQLAKAIEELTDEISDRKQAEGELSLAHQRLSDHVENTPLAVIEWDKDLFIKRWSKRAEEVFGWTASEALGINMYDRNFPVVHEEDVQAVAEIAEQLIKGTVNRNVGLNRNYTKDGNVVYCEWYNSVLRDEDGNVVTILSLVHDVTERKRAEEALRGSEDRLRLVIDTIPVMAWSVRPDGVVDFLNQRWIDYTGLTLEQCVADPAVPIHPEDAPGAFEKWSEKMATGEPYEDEMRLRRADGEYHWFLVRTEALRDEQGKIIKWYGSSVDIEDRKQAEAALQKSEDHLRLVLDTTPALIHTFRPDGYLDYFNQRWLEYGGRSLEELQGWGWTASIPPDDVERIVDESNAGFASGEPFQHEGRFRRADGEYRWMLHLKVPLRDEHGNIVKWHGSSIDIEDRKQAEEALDERLRFETLVTELSAAFANLPPNEVDREIDKWLQTLAKSLGVDRVSFFQFEEDWTTLYRSQSYSVPGIKPLPPAPMGMKDQFPWITDQLRQGVTVKWSRIPDDIPEEAVKEKEYAARLGAKSGLNIPVRMAGSVICAITFTSIATYRNWPDAMVARLRLVGEIFAAGVERKRAEEQLKQSESQLSEAQRMAHVGSWNWDLQKNALHWSDELYRIFGVDRKAFNPAYEDLVAEFVHADDRALVRGITESALKARKAYSFYNRIVRPDGEERVIHVRGDIVSDGHGNPIRVFGAAQDVTERKRAEEKLETTSEQLRALSARLQSAREEEGIRIARELHDELGAALTSLKWDLEEVVEVISESTDLAQNAGLQKRMEVMIGLTDITVNAVRRIVSELRPMALDELGLSEAVECQARQFQDRTGIFVHCDCVVEHDELSWEQSTAAFRISQEALTNILRHAQATTVYIQLRKTHGEFILTISDNGRGITEEEKLGRRTLGLLGMRERAHLIGGTIDFIGSEGKGTVVTVRIPISSLKVIGSEILST